MFRKRGPGALIAALATTALVAAACGGGGDGSGDSGAGAQGGTYSANISEPDALGPPSMCYASECGQPLQVLFAGLVDLDQDGELINRVAESIETEDSQTWTITLKEGWTFHNGEPVNADAYIRGWNWAAYGPNAADTNQFFSQVEGYDAMNPSEEGAEPEAEELSGLNKLGEYQFEVTLAEPFSQFKRSLLYSNAFAATAEECLEDVDACNENPIGNGPYQMVEWVHDQKVTVERWDNYQGENKGKADQINFQIYSDYATAFNDWRAGNLDIMNEPIPENIPQARQLAGDRLHEATEGSFTYMGFPLYQDQFTPKMRHALSLAINREAIIENLRAGLGEPAASLVPSVIPGGGGNKCQWCTHDPQRAKQLMEEAGGLPMDQITIWLNAGAGHEPWVKAVANAWRDTFGLDYTLETPQFNDYLDTLESHNITGPFRLGWGQDYPSMVNFLKPIYTEGLQSNYTGYANEEFANLMQQGNQATSQDEAIEYYTQAEQKVLETMPTIPMWFDQDLILWSENIDNFVYDDLNQTPMYERVAVTQ